MFAKIVSLDNILKAYINNEVQTYTYITIIHILQ